MMTDKVFGVLLVILAVTAALNLVAGITGAIDLSDLEARCTQANGAVVQTSEGWVCTRIEKLI